MKESRNLADRIRSILLVLLPALILALLMYGGLSGQFARPHREGQGPDRTPPTIYLTRDNRYYVLPGEQYEEEGYAAYDDRDGDLTRKVEISVNGDMVRYRVSDSAGNTTLRFRRIPRADSLPGTDSLEAEAP